MIETALILAGGQGSRLRCVLGDVPKVLAPINGRPFIAYLLDRLEASGVRDAVLCTGVQGDRVEAAVGAHHGGMRIRYSREYSPRGTAGAARDALDRATDPALILNGDSYCEADLAGFVQRQREDPARGALVVARTPDPARFGSVTLDGDHVASFKEKSGRSVWVSAGIYLLPHRFFRDVPVAGESSLERAVLPGHAEELRAFPTDAALLDIGTPEAYRGAVTFFGART